MRLTLIISTLDRGGAERVASILASAWAERGYEVTLLTIDSGETPAYPLHPRVNLKRLGLHSISKNSLQAILRNFRRVRVLGRSIRDTRPDLVISFIDTTNVLTILATRFLRIPVIAHEDMDPALHRIGRAWSGLRRLVYPLCSMLVCPVEASLVRFQRMMRVRGRGIPNPIDVPRLDVPRSNQPRVGRVLVAMGRLVPQKGFDLLLEAFSKIAGQHPDWKLVIYGSGPLMGDLQTQARSLGLANRVHLPGVVSDPFERLRNADLFVLSSRFEGFGMALAEAMVCGLPAIGFNCPEGPSVIIRDGIDGLLVPPGDVSGLASAMDRLMSDDEERRKFAQRAPEVLERFSVERVLSMWESLFVDVLRGRPIVARSARLSAE